MFLHHANMLVGEKENILPALFLFLETSHGIACGQNPNLTELHLESLGIAESRQLIERQSSTGFGGERKIFIVSALSITGEAQNALLKVFEEPTPSTHFFLIVPSVELLLPTLRSRLSELSLGGIESLVETDFTQAKKFLSAGPRDRLSMIEKLTDKKKSKKEDVPHFLTVMEQELHRQYVKREITDKISFKDTFLPLWRAKKLLHAPGVGNKLVLEELALTLPVI